VRFRLRRSGVRDLLTRDRPTGDVAPKPPRGGYPAQRDATGIEALKTLVQATPEATRQELCTPWSTTPQVMVSAATVRRAWATLGRPRKKNFSRRRARAAGGPTATGRVSRPRQAVRS
jgi:hypothetical protein